MIFRQREMLNTREFRGQSRISKISLSYILKCQYLALSLVLVSFWIFLKTPFFIQELFMQILHAWRCLLSSCCSNLISLWLEKILWCSTGWLKTLYMCEVSPWFKILPSWSLQWWSFGIHHHAWMIFFFPLCLPVSQWKTFVIFVCLLAGFETGFHGVAQAGLIFIIFLR